MSPAVIPPAVVCCKNLLTLHPKFQNNKVSEVNKNIKTFSVILYLIDITYKVCIKLIEQERLRVFYLSSWKFMETTFHRGAGGWGQVTIAPPFFLCETEGVNPFPLSSCSSGPRAPARPCTRLQRLSHTPPSCRPPAHCTGSVC